MFMISQIILLYSRIPHETINGGNCDNNKCDNEFESFICVIAKYVFLISVFVYSQ